MDFYGIKLKADVQTDAGVDLATPGTPLDTVNVDTVDADTVNGTTYNGTTVNGTTINASLVNATTLNGTSTFAKWGDLAENYRCKSKPDVGTVLCVSKDEDTDVEPCLEDLCVSVVGAVSEKPAFSMMSDLEDSVTVGLVGMIPIKVIGPISKSDFIVSAGNGCARAGKKEEIAYKIGVANETNSNSEIKLVKCMI